MLYKPILSEWIRAKDTVFCLILEELVMMSQKPSVYAIKEYMISFLTTELRFGSFGVKKMAHWEKNACWASMETGLRDVAFSKTQAWWRTLLLLVLLLLECVHNIYTRVHMLQCMMEIRGQLCGFRELAHQVQVLPTQTWVWASGTHLKFGENWPEFLLLFKLIDCSLC